MRSPRSIRSVGLVNNEQVISLSGKCMSFFDAKRVEHPGAVRSPILSGTKTPNYRRCQASTRGWEDRCGNRASYKCVQNVEQARDQLSSRSGPSPKTGLYRCGGVFVRVYKGAA